MKNFPTLKGKTISLCDNSGSAHGACVSSYGTTTVSTIANLSGVMTAINSDSGQVGVFGDKLFIVDIDKEKGVLSQLDNIENVGQGVGGGTENGIWVFFDGAIKNKTHYDNIFIYSDQQAGHGGLYGIDKREYSNFTVQGNNNYYDNSYIDVLKLVEVYRQTVNPKVNIFSVQVGGYDNNILPESLYRGAILAGWTGNEVLYAKYLIDLWNESEKNESEKDK